MERSFLKNFMEKIKYIILFSLVFSLPVFIAYSQDNGTKESGTKENNSKPLELPNFIIQGREQLNVRTGIKQSPEKPGTLTKKELDSLNSLEKRLSLLLPTEPLPSRILNDKFNKGYIRADFGRFTTATAEAGYEFKAGEYEIFGKAGGDYSSGHIDNSGYDKIFLDLNADYTADEKYWIFGGSKTRTGISFKKNDYKLYSVPNPAQRNTMNLGLNVNTEGNYEGFAFNTGAGFNTLQLSQNSSNAFDNSINGYLSVTNLSSDYEIGGDLSVDLHSVSGNGVHFIQADAFGTYIHEDLTLKLKGGFQAAHSSGGIQRAGLLVEGNLDLRLSELFSLRGNAVIGLENNSLNDIFIQNPYLYSYTDVDFSYNLPDAGISLFYYPDEDLAVSVGADFGLIQRAPGFIDTTGGTFAIDYENVTKLETFAEMSYKFTGSDLITANLALEQAKHESNKFEPYSIPLKILLNYHKKWLEKLGTQFGIYYIGQRYTDLNNLNTLPGYIDLRIRADYSVNDMFLVYCNLENLFNQEIYIWNGYKERGVFISAGVLLKF